MFLIQIDAGFSWELHYFYYLPAFIFGVVTSVKVLKDLLLYQILNVSLTFTHIVKYVPFFQDLLKTWNSIFLFKAHGFKANGSYTQTLSLLQVCMYKCQKKTA